MQVTVVTSFGERGYQDYGRRFIETFDRHAGGEIDLLVYAEHQFAHNPEGRMTVRPLFGVDLCADFIDRYADNKLASGREPTKAWKQKDRDSGYSFKTDAVKFARKVFAISDAARRLPASGMLVWLDADVVALERFSSQLFHDLLADADVAYLGREGTHSECGFLAFRMPAALTLVRVWEAYYESGRFLEQPEWHDSFLFDEARRSRPHLKYRDLSPGGRGHVWCNSPLARYFDHLKGERKAMGFSPERRNII